MIDSELRNADNILADRQEPRFAAKGIIAVEDPKTLAHYIPTEGWSPVDAKVHVSNLSTLVSRLGGRELYGDNDCAPARELLQNAADAIEARRIIQKKADWGSITLRTGNDVLGSWVEIEDDGVGMAPDTLTGAFLDFGKSFWSSTESIVEFPELAAADFRSIGKFGVGFFSVFMWGDRVRVTSRRFDASKRDTHVLTFEKGVSERPILREADPDEHLVEGGTRVRVWLQGVGDAASSWMRLPERISYEAPNHNMSPRAFAKWLCPMLGIKIFEEREGSKALLVPITDWQTLKFGGFQDWSIHPRFPRRNLEALPHIRPIRNAEGTVVARAALSAETAIAWVMVGGMRVTAVPDCVGAFAGEPRNASREQSWVNVPQDELRRWADQQSKLISKNYSATDQAECSRLVDELGGSTKELFIARATDKFLKGADLVAWARSRREIRIVSFYEFDKLSANLGFENLRDDVLFEPTNSGVVHFFSRSPRPEFATQLDPERVATFEALGIELLSISQRFGRPVLKAIAAAWNCPVEELIISNELDENIGSGEFYSMDGVEVILRDLPVLDPPKISAR
jgi:hypothetical protein